MGAHWLHYGDHNFYKQYGEQQGFSVYQDPREVFLDRENIGVEQNMDSLTEALDELEQAIAIAAESGIENSLAGATANMSHLMSPIAKFIVGPWSMGKELDELSLLDYASLEGTTDYFCKEGFGSLVAHHGSSLPVSLNTTVSEIDHSGSEIIVHTNNGALRTKAVILTVSTGVLAAGDIRFIPELPLRKVESFNSISMGTYEHIWLQFSTPIANAKPDVYLLTFDDSHNCKVSACANVSGSSLTYFDVGGNTAKALTNLAEEDKVNFALDRLRSDFGNDISRTFVKGAASSWATNPLTQGAYASASPGAYAMRKVLREPVDDKVFFAGEACHPTMWASVAGAHLSGHDVALEVMATIK